MPVDHLLQSQTQARVIERSIEVEQHTIVEGELPWASNVLQRETTDRNLTQSRLTIELCFGR